MIIVVALCGVLAAWFAFARPRALGERGTPPPTTPVSLSVIVPARDEAHSLPALLRSLAGQTVPVAELIVVDDHSTDDTAAIAGGAGATVIAAPPLPTDWSGKNWACATGAAAATGSHLLFLDADTVLAPMAVGELVALHGERGGLVSVQPFHRVERPYEQLAALFNAVAVLGSGSFSLRRSSMRPAAFGPCLLTSAADYARVGGHAAVRDQVVEDIALAARYAAQPLPVTVRLGGDSISFRMYPDGLRSLLQGFSKNIAMGARLADPVPVMAAVVWVIALAASAAALVSGTFGWVGGTADAPVLAAVAWLVMVVHLRWLLRRLGSFRLATSVLYVVPLAVFVVVFARSAWLVARRKDVTWRGRSVASRPAPGSVRG